MTPDPGISRTRHTVLREHLTGSTTAVPVTKTTHDRAIVRG